MVTQHRHPDLEQQIATVQQLVDDIQGARHDEMLIQFAQTNAMIEGMASKADIARLEGMASKSDIARLEAKIEEILARL